MSHKQADSGVETAAEPRGGSLRAGPREDRPGKPATAPFRPAASSKQDFGRRRLFSGVMSTAGKIDQAFPLREVLPECDRMGDLCCHCP